MIINDEYSLLFIEPNSVSSDPIIDEYTLRLAYQLMHFTHVPDPNARNQLVPMI
jgi:hypothetical protein